MSPLAPCEPFVSITLHYSHTCIFGITVVTLLLLRQRANEGSIAFLTVPTTPTTFPPPPEIPVCDNAPLPQDPSANHSFPSPESLVCCVILKCYFSVLKSLLYAVVAEVLDSPPCPLLSCAFSSIYHASVGLHPGKMPPPPGPRK